MQQQIRNQVFETNSSSSHSITISENCDELMDMSFLPNENGNLILDGGEFGWQWTRYNDAKTKANYCAIDNINNELLIEVLKEQTGAKNIIFNFSTEDYESDKYSYIDHDSIGISSKAFESKEKLRQFIFNSNSWLFLGNDNNKPPINFYDVTKQMFQIESFIKDEIRIIEIDRSNEDSVYFKNDILWAFEKLHIGYDLSIDLEKGELVKNNTVYKFKVIKTKNKYIIEFPLNQVKIISNSCEKIYNSIIEILGDYYHLDYDNLIEIEEFQEEISLPLLKYDEYELHHIDNAEDRKAFLDKSERKTIKIKCKMISYEQTN